MDNIDIVAVSYALSKCPGLLKKLYDDAFSPSVKQIGEFLEEITKTILLVGYPVGITASFHDRISKKVRKIAENVPEEIRVMPQPQLFMGYLDGTKFLPNKTMAMDAYDTLLSSALNKEMRDFIHPAFITILPQLSHDEILILAALKHKNYNMTRRNHFNHNENKFYKWDIIGNDFPLDMLQNKELYLMYCTHLDKLDLTNFPQVLNKYEHDEVTKKQTAQVPTFSLQLSEFGKLFVKTCIK